MALPTLTPPPRESEPEKVRRWRHDEAVEAGLSEARAWRFADSDVDISVLRKLVAKGCAPELISRIVV